MKIILLLVVILMEIVPVSAVYSQTADSIISMNIKARGGLSRIGSIKSIKMKGITNFQGMKAPFDILLKRPDKMRLDVYVQGDTIIQAYNGNTAWASLPSPGEKTKITKLSPQQAKSLKDQADIDGPLIHYKQKGYTAQYVGIDKVEGHTAYKLCLTRNDGFVTTFQIDKKSHLTISETSIKKIKSNPVSPLPDKLLEVTSYFNQYKNTKGLVLPYNIKTKVDGKEISDMVIHNIILNARFQNSIFNYPKSE